MDKPKERSLFLAEQVDQDSIQKIVSKIIDINDDDEQLKFKLKAMYGVDYHPRPIKLYIDSYGGMVYQCLGLTSVMDKSVTPIHTFVTGCAMSAGFMIAIHGHRKFCYSTTTFMYHQLSSGAFGELKTIEESVEQKKKLHKTLEELVLKKTKIGKKRLKEVYEMKQDWFMTAEEALEVGVVDEIL